MSKTIYKLVMALCCLLPLGTVAQDTFEDRFNLPFYNQNNGSMNFSGNWTENGEGTSATGGRIQISGGQLQIVDMDGVSIQRSLDLSGATSATLTLDYTRVNGNEIIAVQLYDGASFNTVALLDGNGSVNYTLTPAERNASAAIRFITDSGNWSGSEEYRIDNVRFTATIEPAITITDLTIDEGAGTATFTATHTGQNVLLPFTVNYSTTAITATDGLDFNSVSGTMLFNGTVGDSEIITVNILEDLIYEQTEVFEIRMNSTTNASVNITDRGVGSITDNEVVLGNTPLVLFDEFDGYMDYASTGGSLRTQDNNNNPCSFTTSSSNTLTSSLPAGATIDKAILYWSNSGSMDPQVTFEGTNIDATLVYRTSIIGLEFHNHSADVTAMLQAMPDPSTNVFDFSGLTIDNSGSYCSSAVTLGGWALMVFYSAPGLPATTINLYQGFDGNQNTSTSFSLSGFYAIGSMGSKTTILSWEGDQTLANNESLFFNTPLTGNNLLTGDGDNTGGNPFNSTIYDNVGVPVTNDVTPYGVDLDTYDVSAFILPGETSATTQVNVGQDFVMMNAVVLKVPSNIIVGNVFEDINYGGGPGRDRATASGVGISGVTVELYDNSGVLAATTTTNATGQYDFAGMQNGNYQVRVVNNTIRSSRPNGSTCATCLPVQTFKSDFVASTVVPDQNKVGGNNPAATDPGVGILAGAQSTGTITITSEGVVGVDFGFNFNTIVNTNETGQGSLNQFIVNSNILGEAGMDIEANLIFDPQLGEDLSVFMIPPTADALGRPADANFAGGYFSIVLPAGPLPDITGDFTIIDGRTQTAYSGDTNSGSVGAGGTTVGVGLNTLPAYELPEIEVFVPDGDLVTNQGSDVSIRYLSLYTDDRSAIVADQGSITLEGNLIGVTATAVNGGAIKDGVEIRNGTSVINGNYIATNADSGIYINGGTSTIIRDNHLTDNGDVACKHSIEINNGSGIEIRSNLIERSGGLGIDAEAISSAVIIDENTITTSGFIGGGCLAGILLGDDDAQVTGNIIHTNAGAGVELKKNSSGNLISQNSIYANGTAAPSLGIDIDQDGVTLNDTNDSDNGPNTRLNFPIFELAAVSGPNLILEGWARPGSVIEVFLTDIEEGTASPGDNQFGFASDYGEGQTYLITVTEGSAADLNNTVSNYTDLDGNTDNTNKFRFVVPKPAGVAAGALITSTATISNSTSEFSPLTEIKIPTIITNRRITYRVKE